MAESAPLIGIIEFKKFSPEKGYLFLWLNKFEFLLEKNRIPDERKSYFLLNLVETHIYVMVRKEIAPYNPYNLSYENLIQTLERMFSIYRAHEAFVYRFVHRKQFFGETITQYASALRQLINKFEFGPVAEKQLRIHFLNGLRSEKVKNKVRKLQYSEISFDSIVLRAEAVELDEKNDELHAG
ncbi:hypothetical protein M0802_015491 [Mischocyttarus mexicanus]|nr:hypothetical protein M0802_015491 [Mischocyttarus mexicanus]